MSTSDLERAHEVNAEITKAIWSRDTNGDDLATDVAARVIAAALARAREEGAREATMRLKLRLEATQMTLGDLWNRVDTFDPRMAPDLEEVVKLALEPAP
jgi:hypothetical protein